YSFIHHTDVSDGSLPPTPFYEHLARHVPRQKITGGVRVDGVYVCDTANPLFKEALRFFTDETVTSFLLPQNEAVYHTTGIDSLQLAYTVEKESIIFSSETGRTMKGRFQEEKLSFRVTYPNGQQDSRWYSFVPFED